MRYHEWIHIFGNVTNVSRNTLYKSQKTRKSLLITRDCATMQVRKVCVRVSTEKSVNSSLESGDTLGAVQEIEERIRSLCDCGVDGVQLHGNNAKLLGTVVTGTDCAFT